MIPLTNTTDHVRRAPADQRQARTRRPLLGRSWPTAAEMRVRAARIKEQQ